MTSVDPTRGAPLTTDGHLSPAQPQSRASGRRERQVAEITALVQAGNPARAAGLALEHVAEFPADAGLLARIAPTGD